MHPKSEDNHRTCLTKPQILQFADFSYSIDYYNNIDALLFLVNSS